MPRWADDVLAGQPYADRDALIARADEAARSLSDDELEAGAGRSPADRRARWPRDERSVAARAGRGGPLGRRHRRAAGGRQRGVRGAVRAGLPDPRRRARRGGDPGRARPPARQRRRDRARRDRRQPAPDRAAAAGGCGLRWPRSRRTSSTPPPGRPPRDAGPPGDAVRRLAGRERHRRRRACRLDRERLAPGDYVLRFDTGGYGLRSGFYPEVVVVFTSPTTSTTTCPCCSRRTATRPTVAADLVLRARRAIVDGAERAGCVGIADGRIVAVTAYDDPPAAAVPSTSPTTRCCCPGWSTPTCTSTSRAARSGRASRPRPARLRPAA